MRRVNKFRIFLALLWLPLIQKGVQLGTGLDLDPPIEENRRSEWNPKRFEGYLSERVGFRNLLIRLKNQIDYSLFNYSDRVLIGKEGQLFYRVALDESVWIDRFHSENMAIVLKRLEQLGELLENRGIKFVVISTPNAHSLFPEKLPDNAPTLPSVQSFQWFRSMMPGLKHLTWVDAQEAFENNLKGEPWFYKTDFHPTSRAGFEIGRSFIKALSGRNQTCNIKYSPVFSDHFRGSINNFLATFRSLLEPAYLNAANAFVELSFSDRPSPEYSTWYERTDAPFPDAVVYGSSFLNEARVSGIQKCFKRFEMVQISGFKNVLEELPNTVKIVVLEHIETHLLQLMQDGFFPKTDP